MRKVAIISELSHHKLKTQQDEYKGMPQYLAPDELSSLFRQTTRKGMLEIHMISLAITADKRQKFIDFFQLLPKNSKIVSKEDGNINYRMPVDEAVKLWAVARKRGAAQAGGEARSEIAEREFWEGFEKIKDRWHLPSKPNNFSSDLLEEAGTTRNTVVRYLGYTRLEWRKLSSATRERILKRKERRNAKGK